MMSRQQPQQQQPQQQHQNTTSGSTNATPSISSNLRMGQNANHQAVSVVVETRPMPPSQGGRGPGEEYVEGSEESDQDGGRGMVVLEGPGDPDYAPSSGAEGFAGSERRRRRDGDGSGLAIANDDRDNLIDEADINTANQLMAAGNNGESSERKHGKRLTTSEEVSLFDICNRHAPDFGQRSNLCKWWITVTAEFTRDQGHPYSWHSVRRKVEMVTKQRMRFLEEQREKGAAASGDLSNPRWRAAVDAWIPTWQKWEEAEARRIEKRDSRKTKKRKSRGWEYPWDTVVAPQEDDGWRAPSVEHTPTGTPGYNQIPVQVQPSVPVSSTPIPSLPQSNVSVPVRLPPGFDSMFSNPNTSPLSPAPAPLAQKTPYQSTSPAPAVAGTAASTEPNMMAALLETLGKLNKHLDANPVPRATLAPGQQNHHLNGNEHNIENIMLTPLSLLKEELKREVREELRQEIEGDRASLEEKLDSVQRTQEMILEMLRQEPA